LLVEYGKNAVDSKGKKYFDRSYSGDSEPIDVRRKQRVIEWPIDIVWIRKGSPFLIEIALSENWRSLVGEFALAKVVNPLGFCYITDFEYDFMNDLTAILEEVLDFKRWYFYIVDKNEKPKKVAMEFCNWLKEDKFSGWK
jgi:hypothetical protein